MSWKIILRQEGDFNMGTPYSAIAIANYFVDCSKGKSDLTPMKMQKLIFIAHGWYLAYF